MTTIQKESTAFNAFLLNSLAGSMGGIAQVFSGQPFDIVKVRMQSQSQIKPIYKSAGDWVKKIYRNEGPLAFYKGTLAPLSGVAFCTSVQFGMNQLCKSMAEKYNRNQNAFNPEKLSIKQYFGWGAIVGFGVSFLAAPIEHIRIKMQKVKKAPGENFSGSFDAFSKILSKHGVKGIFRGQWITMARDTLAYAIFFGVYESLKQRYTNPNEPKNLPLLMGIGSVASILLWTVTYPFDVVKTVYQSDRLSNPRFMNSRAVIKSIYKKEGLRGFTKGFTPCLARAPVIYAATIFAYEQCLSRTNHLLK